MRISLSFVRLTLSGVALVVSLGLPRPALSQTDTNSPSLDKSFDDISTAAQRGDAQAQYELGWRYYQEQDVHRDYRESMKWLTQSADQGNAPAQLLLGKMAAQGEGQMTNHATALDWYLKAADHKLAEAAFQAGLMYRRGLGVPANQVEAARWYRQAALQGHVGAELGLAILYGNGQGVPQNDKEAVLWFRQAAGQGSPEAQYFLGVRYDIGKGVRVNHVEAYKWMILSAAQDYPSAINARDKLIRKLTKDQIADAQRRAAAFSTQPAPILQAAAPPDAVQDKGDTDTPLESSGTGFFITDDGYLLTSFHLIENATRILVKIGKNQLSATLQKSDPVNDLAVLKVSVTNQSLAVALSRNVKIGDPIFTVGFPSAASAEPKMTDGNIRSLSSLSNDPRQFQINLAAQPDNSGGPLVNTQGQVVGIVNVQPPETGPVINRSGSSLFVIGAVKSTYAAALLESLPELTAKLKDPAAAKERKFDELVKETQDAIAQVLVY